MTLDEIDRLTIADVRAINERAESALATLRSLGLMGGAAAAQPAQSSTTLAAVAQPAHGTRVRTPLTEAELADMAAQKAALLARNLPDEILQAERTPPP